MRMVVNAQPALIGLQTHNAQMNLKSPLPKIEIETTPGSLNAHITLPKIEIDQSQCFSESGLKGPLELIAENATNSVSAMYESVGRIAEQGDQLTIINKNANPIAEQAFYNAFDQFERDFNMVTMPKSRPKITLIEGKVTFDPTPTKVNISAKLTKPEMNYQPGKVEVYLRQKNSIDIRFEGLNLDLKG